MIQIGVTGSNGFIGWHLCNILKLYANKFKLVEFKRDWFEDKSKLDQFVKDCNIIVHLAGLNRHDYEQQIFNTNVSIASKLIESFFRTNYKGHVLFSSSIQEERNNTFGNSKKEARELFTKWAIETGSLFKGLIIPNVYGSFGKPFYNSVIATFCHQLINNETPKIEIDSQLNLIYINDLVKEFIELFENDTTGAIKIKHTDTYKVSEILELLIKFKFEYIDNGQIPSLNNKFETNLFNTFRSYCNLKTYFPIKYKNNIDNRGNFIEIIKFKIGGQVSFSTTKSGITRGNHFHTRKIERFSVIKGKALIKLRKFGTSEVFDYYLNGDDPAYVDMPIWFTHNITNIGDDELYTMFWINEFYDANDPDTYLENV
jgi:UDP-2-acetamido-2,6-beta-L-arabino-hexul-4-ose reductase